MIHLLERSHEQPSENLALDEALLMGAEAGELPPALRLWQFFEPAVVLGRGSRAGDEVDLEFCRRARIPVLRRCSGGASVVGGPGCLMYSVVVDLLEQPQLRSLDRVHPFVMQTVLGAVARSVGPEHRERLRFQGTCDLTYENRKFSGNSLRIARNHLLYHGTILWDADLDRISACLATAPRQPLYRDQRPHREFLTNVPADRDRLVFELARAFKASVPLPEWPQQRTEQLVAERYGREEWTLRH